MLWAFSFLEYLVEIKNKHVYNGFFFQQKRLIPGSTNRENKFLFLIVYKKMIISGVIAKCRLSYSPEPSITGVRVEEEPKHTLGGRWRG